MKAYHRTLLAVSHDAVACGFAWLIAYWLRFDLAIPSLYFEPALVGVAWLIPMSVLIFVSLRLYRGLWRYASLADLRQILFAVMLAAVCGPTVLYMLTIPVPRSVLIIHPIVLAALMCGSRLTYRAWSERDLKFMVHERKPVLVLGAEEIAINLIRELKRSAEWRVVGMLDDDGFKHGRQLHGVNVLGGLATLPIWPERVGVKHAIIAMPQANYRARRRAVELCQQAGVRALTVPSADDLVSGRVTVSQVRHLELDDLLGRDPVVLDTAGLTTWLAGRVVMVTGAGGSIGAELCRQIARYQPRCLILYELNEFAMYAIEQEFSERGGEIEVVCAMGDVRDKVRVQQILREYRPSVIFHAAAYKHVPLMEGENAWQAVLNNVLGTRVIGEAANAHGVEKFVLISTDKAVNPTSVMGATKRLAEMVCQALQRPAGTRFVMVRFGNVLGSTGSVIPKFREQIARGGPVTVTHPDITRFFMSIPEAVQLVLQAGLMGKGGEIFVLDMGEAVKIADLARDMIQLSGLTLDDVRIVYTGLRPGEKLFEEPLARDESTLPTPHAQLRIARARQEDARWLVRLTAWLEHADLPDDETVKRDLARWIPEYRSPVPAPPQARVAS